ncbi:TPA: glycosyltransferase family 9 protein [Candidatus Woesearchaeota archaeon]|nr:glycosyltransferase family 9 protein [Candidatus Woesearchaeota archaeon]
MRTLRIRLIDRLAGDLVCLLLGSAALLRKSLFNTGFNRFNSYKANPARVKSILFIQLWGIGETILTLPAIMAVKKRFSKASISVLATSRNRAVYDSVGLNVIELGMKPGQIIRFIMKNLGSFDMVVDMEEYLRISSVITYLVSKASLGFSGGIRSTLYNATVSYDDCKHTAEAFFDLARSLGVKGGVKALVSLGCADEDAEGVKAFLGSQGLGAGDQIIGICTGAAESARSRIWPHKRFAKLADQIIGKYNCCVVFTGTSSERRAVHRIMGMMGNRDRAVNAAGCMSIRQLFCFVKQCRLFISNDTGPMHIAAAQGTKTIGLFGPNTPLRWHPFGESNISIYRKTRCSPCINTHLGQVPECRFGNAICMKRIKVSDVMEAVERLVRA